MTCLKGVLKDFLETGLMELAPLAMKEDSLSVEKLSRFQREKRVHSTSEIPCRISSDPHESRHHRPAVSTMDSVKLKSP